MSTTTLLQSPALTVTGGLDLLDSSDGFLEDISSHLISGSVTRKSDAKIHGKAKLTLTKELSWQSNRLRPYITLTDQTNGETERWNLGVYLPETPARIPGETPAVYEVEAYDKLLILDQPYGSTYRIAAATGYIASVETLLTAAGVTHSIDPTSSAKTLPTDLVWELGNKNTTLLMVNELLSAIGYVNIYTDRSGIFRSGPWVSPASRGSAWTYDVDDELTTTVVSAKSMIDYFDVPNKWVFVRDDPDPGVTLPAAGAGIYTVTNSAGSPSSIDSRGRTITKIHFLKVADHASLVTLGDAIVDADKQPLSVIALTSLPNPLHWHETTVKVTSNELGLTSSAYTETAWTLPLKGGAMTHQLVEAT